MMGNNVLSALQFCTYTRMTHSNLIPKIVREVKEPTSPVRVDIELKLVDAKLETGRMFCVDPTEGSPLFALCAVFLNGSQTSQRLNKQKL